MLKNSDRILITGGTGLIGANLVSRLEVKGFEIKSLSSKDDLRSRSITRNIFNDFKPNIVYHLAAKVGGILANSSFKSDFYSDNVLINTNVINSCIENNVEYIFAMGTGCAYPKRLEKNILKEEDFLDGIPEFTNDAYAYAKRGLLVHLKALSDENKIKYLYCLPANIYGPNDNFHPKNSHVVPGLIRRFCDAVKNKQKEVVIWGDGTAKRDFMYIDDCIDAMILLTEKQAQGTFNVSSQVLTSIKDLAFDIKNATGYEGIIKFDSNKPAGQMQRKFDNSRINSLGWHHKIDLNSGIKKTVTWFLNNPSLIRER